MAQLRSKQGSRFFWRLVLLGCLLGAWLWPGPAPGQANYPANYRFTAVPDPLAGDNPPYPLLPQGAPTPGQSFTDLRFGTRLTRVSQAPLRRHEYSRFDPCNCGQTMILLGDISTGERLVYRTQPRPYDQAGNLVRSINNLEELRWDRTDPDLLWGLRDFSIVTLNVQTGQETIIKNFAQDAALAPIFSANPRLYRVTRKDEGEASQDNRFWVLALQNGDDPAHPEEAYVIKYLCTWDRLQDKILGTYQLATAAGQSVDWVGMSPLGRWALIGADPTGGGNIDGLVMANKEFTVFHKLAAATGHSDVGLDSQGREVIVMQNSRTDYVDLIPLDLNSREVTSVADYQNNLIKPLVRLFYDSASPRGLNSGVHISCNHPGYSVISTYIPAGAPEQNWLDRAIILVRLETPQPRAWYLAKVYNTTQQYHEETQATITNDGARIFWASNWGQSVPEPQLPSLFTMQLEMPAGWQGMLAGPLPAWVYLLQLD